MTLQVHLYSCINKVFFKNRHVLVYEVRYEYVAVKKTGRD